MIDAEVVDEENDGSRGRVRSKSEEENRRMGKTRWMLLLLLIASALNDNSVLPQPLPDATDLHASCLCEMGD